jgi:DNA polymerase-1
VLLAHYIGGGRLFRDLMNGEDPHTSTAAGVFGVSLDQVTKDQRQAAKAINFAVVYGAGPAKVAAMAGVSEKEAKRFLELHQKTFPEIYSFKNAVIKECRRRKPPHIKTILGRKRRLPTIHAKDYGLRGYAERQAVNSLIQGSAADLIKLAMVRLDSTLPDDMNLILSVHDELVTIVPEAQTGQGVELVSEAMLGTDIASLIKIPLKSDVKVVDRWAEAK